MHLWPGRPAGGPKPAGAVSESGAGQGHPLNEYVNR